MSKTLTPTLTIASTDTSSDALSFSVTDALTVGEPMRGISRISVSHSSKTDLLPKASQPTQTYIYLKNTDSSNHIELYTGDEELFGSLFPGEFAFFPVHGGEGFKLQADTAACVVEHGYWTKA